MKHDADSFENLVKELKALQNNPKFIEAIDDFIRKTTSGKIQRNL